MAVIAVPLSSPPHPACWAFQLPLAAAVLQSLRCPAAPGELPPEAMSSQAPCQTLTAWGAPRVRWPPMAHGSARPWLPALGRPPRQMFPIFCLSV